MKIKLLFIFVLLLTACQLAKENKQIPVFNNLHFQTLSAEKVVKLSPEVKEMYFGIVGERPVQVPLFKCLKGPDYHIFIGIPYNTNLNEISGTKLADKLNPLSLESDGKTYDFKSYQKDSVFVSEYAEKLNEDLLYILAISNTKEIHINSFNIENLSNRIISSDRN